MRYASPIKLVENYTRLMPRIYITEQIFQVAEEEAPAEPAEEAPPVIEEPEAVEVAAPEETPAETPAAEENKEVKEEEKTEDSEEKPKKGLHDHVPIDQTDLIITYKVYVKKWKEK